MEHFWWKLIYDGNIVLPLPSGRGGGGARSVEFSRLAITSWQEICDLGLVKARSD